MRPDPILILQESERKKWPAYVWAVWHEWGAGDPDQAGGYAVYWIDEKKDNSILYLDSRVCKWRTYADDRNNGRSPGKPYFPTLALASEAIKKAGDPNKLKHGVEDKLPKLSSK